MSIVSTKISGSFSSAGVLALPDYLVLQRRMHLRALRQEHRTRGGKLPPSQLSQLREKDALHLLTAAA